MACRSFPPRPAHVDPLDGAAAWLALLDGAWVVTDHFAGPDSCTILCDPAPRPFRRPLLSRVERALASSRAQGASVKELAAERAYSIGRVSALLTRAMVKLKLRSDAHLVALFEGRACEPPLPPPLGLEAAVAEPGDRPRLALTYPCPRWTLPAVLSRAEAGVVFALIEGASHREIASARGTAPRTVANQIGAIFRKLQVPSQLDLFVALRRRAPCCVREAPSPPLLRPAGGRYGLVAWPPRGA